MKTIMKKIQTGAQWSRYCLRSLFVTFLLMLTFGVGNAWGDNTATITKRSLSDTDWSGIQNDNTSSAYITWKGNDAGQHVTFKLSGGTFKNATWQYFQSTGDQTHKLEWIVDAGYSISVTNVSLVVRSSLNGSTVKVGQADYVDNPYGGSDDFATVSSGTYSPALGNDGYVNVIFKDDYSLANNFIKTIVVTYTIEGTAQTVTYESSNSSFSESAPYKIEKDHVDFYLNIPNWYNSGDGNFYIWNNNTTASIYWEVEQGYTIAVSRVSFSGCNAYTTSKGGFLNLTTYYHPGYSYIWSHTSSGDQSQCLIRNDKNTGTDSFTQSNTTLFPSGSALGNTDYFRLCSTDKDNKSRDIGDSEWEYKIYSATLTYIINPKTYVINLDNEGGDGGTTSVTLTFDSNAHDDISNPTKVGYTFDGWWAGDNGTGTKVIDANGILQEDVDGYTGAGGVWKKDATTTLYAKWVDNSELYFVRFNGNGSTSGSMDNQAFVPGTAQNLTDNTFEKTCTVSFDKNGGECDITSTETLFAFEGWATNSAGVVAYENEEEVNNLTYTPGAIVDLYAKWSATAEEVELPMPTKDDCVFAGWYNLSDEKIGDAGTLYSPSGNITLKAHWRLGAASKNSDDDISSNSIIMNGPHATFTFSGETNITDFNEHASWPIGSGKPEGYKLVQAFDKNINGGRMNYSISWATTNANCSIQVTKISFWVKAYNSNADNHEKAKVAFAGDTLTVGTAALTANEGDYRKFSKATTFAGSSVDIVCINNTENDFDYYIKNISIEYEVYTTAPSPTDGVQQVNVTIKLDAKQTVDVSSLFAYAVAPPSDFTYSYEIVGSPASAGLQGGTNFWASVIGDYTVRAKVATAEDHYGSEWSSTKTIRVNRVPYVFNNTATDETWGTTGNWNASWLPTAEDSVIIRGDLVIANEINIAKLAIEDTAVVIIAPQGGLSVGAGGISGATSDNLILKAGTSGATKGQTGYLRISPEYTGAMPVATVELYSIGYYNKAERETQKAAWQFVGAPIADEGVAAKSVYTKSWIYSWDESTNNWVNNRATLTFSPFVGYETTQYKDASGLKLVYSGTLVSGVDIYALDLTYSSDGYNALANSFAAPIDISQFTASDFINAEPTISVLNTGTQEQSDNPGEDVNAPGKFLSIPVATATDLASSFGYPLVIPSMQGFFVQANSAGAKIKLDYNRLVWTADYSGLRENKPLRAPANTKDGQEELGSLKVTITANGWTDHTYLLESEKYANWYERGYDARKIMSEDMDIYTISGDEKLSVNATNSIIGTRLGVRTGGETAYTLVFTNLRTEDELALYDKETDEAIDINNYTEYTFFAEPNAEINDRFYIIARGDAPAIATDVDHVSDATKAHKFIKDNQLLILKNGVLYNATGEIVR